MNFFSFGTNIWKDHEFQIMCIYIKVFDFFSLIFCFWCETGMLNFPVGLYLKKVNWGCWEIEQMTPINMAKWRLPSRWVSSFPKLQTLCCLSRVPLFCGVSHLTSSRLLAATSEKMTVKTLWVRSLLCTSHSVVVCRSWEMILSYKRGISAGWKAVWPCWLKFVLTAMPRGREVHWASSLLILRVFWHLW